MITISRETTIAFDRRMEQVGVPKQKRAEYHKWMRLYLDCCRKYRHPPRSESSIGPFLEKLAANGQSELLRRQAERAVLL